MQLKELLRNVGLQQVDGSLSREITSLTYDVRRVIPGSAYFATRTILGDGHEFIEEAIARGAVAVICERNRIKRLRATRVEVRDSYLALSEAARVFYGEPSSKLKVVAVAGEYGQSTTALVLKQLLENSGIRTGLIGSTRHEIGERWLPAGRNFPEPLDLQSMLGQMVRAGCEACVIEVRREDLANRCLWGVQLSALVLANLGPSPGGGGSVKAPELVRTLTKLSPQQQQVCAVINIDEAAGCYLTENGAIEVRLTYGFGAKAEIRAQNVHLGPKKSAFQMSLGGKLISCKLPLVGRHNIYSVLAASGAVMALDLDASTVERSLAYLSALSGVMEEVTTESPFQVYVDGAATPAMLSQVLRSLREITPGRILLVMGCREKTSARHRFEMGKVAGEYATMTFLTTDSSGREPAAEIASVIAQGLDQNSGARYVYEEDRAQAIYKAICQAGPGDSVLIAGKGDYCYQELSDTIVPFDDRECARECLDRIPAAPVHETWREPLMLA